MIKMASTAQRVLIVADASEDISPLIAPLRDAGCIVEFAATMERAVELAASMKPTIVLVGGSHGRLNSVDLTMRLRSAVPPEAVPLFIMAPSCQAIECCTETNEQQSTSIEQADPMRSITAIVQQIGKMMHDDGQTLSGLASVQGSVGSAVKVPQQSPITRVACNGVCLDRVRHRAWLDEEELHLTPTEFRLLWELAGHPGYVRSRSDLARACKGNSEGVQSRTIDAHIKAIRRKLGDKALLIETVHGVGYRFRDQEW